MDVSGKIKHQSSRIGSFVNFKFLKFFFPSNRRPDPNISVFTTSNHSETDHSLEHPVLLLGSPGSGKSSVVKQMRMLNQGRDIELLDELNAEKVFLQYDVICGVLKVLERMIVRVEEGDTSVQVSERDKALFSSVSAKLKKIRAKGDFLRDDPDDAYALNTLSRRENVQRYEIPLDKREWARLGAISRREHFVDTLKERFLPAEETIGKPLRINDGFAELIKIPDIWSQIKDKNPTMSSYLYIRKPNGGLPSKKIVASIDKNVEEKVSFTEYPGRIESLVDVLALLNDQAGGAADFRCVVLTVSFADFDIRIDTEEEEEKAYDVLLKLLAELKEDFRTLPIYVIFTKGEVLSEKIEYYHELGILESRIDFPIDPRMRDQPRAIANVIMDQIMNTFIESLKEVWLAPEVVQRFPRQLRLHYDSLDAEQIFNNILSLAKRQTLD